MAIATKVTATALGTTGVSLLGCYFGGVFDGKVEWHSLTETEATSNEYANKVGGKYWMYLTATTNPKNEAWWKKTHQMYVADVAEENSGPKPLSQHFAKDKIKLDLSYSTKDAKALNKVCEEAYKKNLTNDVDFSSTTNTEEKYKLAADILRYCSPLVEKPTTIEANDSTYSGDNMIGKTKGEEKKLVKVTGNDTFWTLQNEWFKSQGNNTSELGAYFNEFFEGQTNQRTLKSNIRDICSSAYKATAPNPDATSTTTNPSSNDVAKYCAFIKS